MKTLKSLFVWGLLISLVLGAYSVIRPYWNRYCLERHIESIAVFGTKHSLHETTDLLMSKMKEEGYRFKETDFLIDKDEKNHVSINLTYTDEVEIFGKPLKKIRLNVGGSAREVKSFY